MIRPSLSLQDVVDRLNLLLKEDPVVVTAVVSTRFNIGDRKVFYHPDIAAVPHTVDLPEELVKENGPTQKDLAMFGMLGLINFLFGLDDKGQGAILSIWEGQQITKFVINPRVKIPKQEQVVN